MRRLDPMKQPYVETDVGAIPTECVVRIVEETPKRHRVYYRDAAGKIRMACRKGVWRKLPRRNRESRADDLKC